MKYYLKVNFTNGNKDYNFSTDLDTLKIGSKVVVETIKGIELATVSSNLKKIESYNGNIALKEILRVATKEDVAQYKLNLKKANLASKIFIEEANKLNLDMRLLSTEYTLDASKIIFTYSSNDRVDFRELLKILASKLKARIELKQIAARDRAQMTGGLGPCGLPLCCSRFLTEFDGISINRAKNQLLTINIPKLSGQCGKLLCCLKFEDDQYTESKKLFPDINTKVIIDNVGYKVSSYNVLSKVVKLDSTENSIFLSLDEINKILHKKEKRRNK